MSRRTFLTIHALVALLIGALALMAPDYLITGVKHAQSNPAAEVMGRTVGVLIASMGFLAFSVRNHPDSPTMRSVLWANLFLQLAILPIDPLAYRAGTFHSLGSFVPNTILHVALAGGLAFYLREMYRTRAVHAS